MIDCLLIAYYWTILKTVNALIWFTHAVKVVLVGDEN